MNVYKESVIKRCLGPEKVLKIIKLWPADRSMAFRTQCAARTVF